MKSGCRSIRAYLESYLDGELEPPQALEVEQHTTECPICRERVVLDRAIRAGVRKAAGRDAPNAALRARIAASLAAEREKSSAVPPVAFLPSKSAWWMAALAAAAAAVVVVQRNRERQSADFLPQPEPSHASVGLDAMLDQFVNWHARPLVPETTNAGDLPRFEPFVGVPVRAPTLSPFGARFLGFRIMPVADERVTAMLQYTMDEGHRISIYVYDPHRIQTSPSRLHPTQIGSQPVYIGHIHGWSIAATEKRGVGYAVTSDLDDEESAELVLAAAPR
jgi:anti-sigma factor RsiW